MKKARIAVILLLGILLASGVACTSQSNEELDERLNAENYPYYAQIDPEMEGIIEVKYNWYIETIYNPQGYPEDYLQYYTADALDRITVDYLIKNISNNSEIHGYCWELICKDINGNQLYPHPANDTGISGIVGGLISPWKPGEAHWGKDFIIEKLYYESSGGEPFDSVYTVEMIIPNTESCPKD